MSITTMSYRGASPRAAAPASLAAAAPSLLRRASPSKPSRRSALLRDDRVDVVVLRERRPRRLRKRRRPWRGRDARFGRELARQTLEQRTGAHRLYEPAIETVQRILSKHARRSKEVSSRPGSSARPRPSCGDRGPVGRLDAERAIDDPARSGGRPGRQRRQALTQTFGPRDFSTGLCQPRGERSRASNGESAMISARASSPQRDGIDFPRGRRRAESATADITIANEKIEPPPSIVAQNELPLPSARRDGLAMVIGRGRFPRNGAAIRAIALLEILEDRGAAVARYAQAGIHHLEQ